MDYKRSIPFVPYRRCRVPNTNPKRQTRWRSTLLFLGRDLATLFPCLRQANGDRLLAALGLATFAALLRASLRLMDRFLNFTLRRFAVLRHEVLLARSPNAASDATCKVRAEKQRPAELILARPAR